MVEADVQCEQQVSLEDSALRPVVFALDGGYLGPLATTLASLAASNRSIWDRIDVRVLGVMTATDRKRLDALGRRLGKCLRFDDLSGAVDDGWRGSGWVTQAAFYRLAIPGVVNDAGSVLYLDSDVLVLDDLGPLLRLPTPAAPIAAVRDAQNPVLKYGIALPGWRDLGLDGDREYFNSGVMIVNLRAWDERDGSERLRRFIRSHPDALRFWDQDALNYVFGDDWQRLDRRWNTFALSPLMASGERYYADAVVPLADLLVDEETAAILHFAGPTKPWQDDYPAGRTRRLYRSFMGTGG